MLKKQKSFTKREREFIKNNMVQLISVLKLEKGKLQTLINEMPASRYTVKRRVFVISAYILNNLQKNLSKCLKLNLALDESTDIKDKPQLAIFVRFVSKNFEMMEELLDLVTLKNINRGYDIKEALDRVLQKNAIYISNIVCIAINGAPYMTKIKQRLIGQLIADT